jgi:hypothetical protein
MGDDIISVCETCAWFNPDTQYCVYRKCFVKRLCMNQIVRDLCYRSIYTKKKPIIDNGNQTKEPHDNQLNP